MKYTLNKGDITVVCSTFGAELVSLMKNGKEYIWQGDPKYWNGQNPILFPVLCSLKDGKVTIAGESFEIRKHGFARKSEFDLNELTEDSVSFILRESEETLKVYPFKFDFIVRHTVTDSGFITSFEICNRSDETMYFHLGGHTGINIPFDGKYKFEEHSVVFETTEYATNYKAPGGALIVDPEGDHDVIYGSDRISLTYEMFANDALMLSGLKSKNVSLLDPDGKGVKMDISGFKALGIWTPSSINSPFLCIEPWNGLPAFVNETGRFEDKPFALSLEPGKKYETSYSLCIID